MSIEFQRIIPILRIFDVDKAKEFYCEFLGFELAWDHRFSDDAPAYLEVSRGEMTLHLSEHHGDGCPGATVFVWMTGIDELHQELTAKNYRYNKPGLEATFYGARCVHVNDPFGNRIWFNERNEEEPG